MSNVRHSFVLIIDLNPFVAKLVVYRSFAPCWNLSCDRTCDWLAST